MGEAKRRAGKKKEVIWTCVIVRREHIPELVANGMQDNRSSLAILTGLTDWLKQQETRPPAKSPLCIACDHEFLANGKSPAAFQVFYSEDPSVKHTMVTGICARCATKPENELLMCRAEELLKRVDGRMLGFGSTGSTTTQ